MLQLAVAFAALLGLVIGSFANVVIYRVPRAESVISPPSACPRCAHRIRPQHNVPVLGWLFLRGRCADCKAPISVRYPLIELCMGGAFAVVVAVWGVSWAAAMLVILAAFTIILSAIDVEVQRLPNRLVGLLGALVLAVIIVAALAEGSGTEALRAAAGAAIVGTLYAGAFVAYPKGLGFGDVKLAPILGAAMAWFGWRELAVGTFAGFLWGALFGVLVIAVTKRMRQVRIPFGPWMFLGAWTGIAIGGAVAGWYLEKMLNA